MLRLVGIARIALLWIFLLHRCLESTMASAFTEACDVYDKCFKVYTDVDD